MTKAYEMQLRAWQKGENYTDGLRLWKQRYGEDIAYRMLCLGANDFNRQKMRAGLSAAFPVNDIPAPDEPAPKPKKPGQITVLKNTVDELGDTVDTLESEVYDLSTNYEDLTEKTLDLGRNVDNLEDSIQDLQEKVEAFLAKAPVPDTPAVAKQKRRDDVENEPAEVREWHKTTYGLMDERVLLKQRLRDLPDPQRRDDRKEAAYRILDITAELDRLFGMIGYYEEHGRVPETVPLDEQGLLYPKRYLNLRTYVSRTKKQLKQTTDVAGRAALEEKIRTWLEEMAKIEIEL